MRLDRLLANMGAGSRKAVKKLIVQGAVRVNGSVVKDCGFDVDEAADKVEAAGKTVVYREFVYLMMNKPAGILSCGDGVPGVKVAADLVGDDFGFYDLSPAGRLDADSEGFLILTNDGNFIHNVISPARNVSKEYFIRTEGVLDENDREAFENGVVLGDGYKCLDASLEILRTDIESRTSEAVVTVHEGKFHQVKRMVLARGKKVTYLKRISVGGVALDTSLKPGEYRELTREELDKLGAL